MLAMIDAAVAGSAPFLPVRLVVFPEFAHAAPVFATVAELLEQLAVPIPNEHTDRLAQQGARARHLHPERDDARGRSALARRRLQHHVPDRARTASSPGTARSIRGFPFEVHASPHDVPGYDEPLFPVADTPIGRLGCAICYDWLFPEAMRQLAANGAEVLIRVSAYMDPWGATEPMNWWTIVNRCRALENMAFVVAANQGASLRTIRRTPGRAAARSSTSTAACSPKPRPGPASASSSRRSTSTRCVTSARRGAATTCWRTCGHRGVSGLPAGRLPARGHLVSDHLRVERGTHRAAET